MPQPGRLSKWNLVCACRACRYWRLREKYRSGRAREAAAFRRELLQELWAQGLGSSGFREEGSAGGA